MHSEHNASDATNQQKVIDPELEADLEVYRSPIAGKKAHTIFWIGADSVTLPVSLATGEGLENIVLTSVAMKPCVGGGANSVHGDMAIPHATLDAALITEDELRPLLRELSACLKERSSCCWGWGWLGPFMLFIWLIDMIMQQCCSGITQCVCHRPTMRECNAIVERYLKQLEPTGVDIEIIDQEVGAQSAANGCIVYFQTWALVVRSSREELP